MNRIRGLTLSLLLLSLIFMPFLASGESVEVLRIDSYEASIEPGRNATFGWTLRNIDSLGKDFNITAEVEGQDSWVAVINPNTVGLAYKEARAFELFVVVPEDATGSRTINVIFRVYQGDALIKYSAEAVTITVDDDEDDDVQVLDTWDNPLPPPMDNEYGVFVLDVVLWLLISIAIVLILSPGIKHFAKKTKTDLDDRILAIIRNPIIIIVFFYGTVASMKVIEDDIGNSLITVLERIYLTVFYLLIFYMILKLFKEVVIAFGHKVAAKTATEIDDVLVPLVEKIGFMVIGIFFLGYIMNSAGIDLTVFIAGGVVVSMVIAFAAQETLSNFFSGIFILTDRPFKRGDKIIFPNGDWYQVRQIGLRSTRLYRYSDAAMVTIPNNKLANDMITNFSNPQDPAKVSMTVGVAYGTDPEKVKKILEGIIDRAPDIVSDDPDFKPVIRFDSMGDWSLNFKIIVWLTDRGQRFTMIDYLNTEIHRQFAQHDIEIPFPQQVVHFEEETDRGYPVQDIKFAKDTWKPPADDETRDEADHDKKPAEEKKGKEGQGKEGVGDEDPPVVRRKKIKMENPEKEAN